MWCKDKKKKLLGTLTDGDIRAIINGQKLNQPIKKIYNRKPNFLIKSIRVNTKKSFDN